jgi:hypothetical protein
VVGTRRASKVVYLVQVVKVGKAVSYVAATPVSLAWLAFLYLHVVLEVGVALETTDVAHVSRPQRINDNDSMALSEQEPDEMMAEKARALSGQPCAYMVGHTYSCNKDTHDECLLG